MLRDDVALRGTQIVNPQQRHDEGPGATGEPVVTFDFTAEGKTGFVLGSAAKHPHDLVLGNYSVHTSPEALYEGEMEIRRIGQELDDRCVEADGHGGIGLQQARGAGQRKPPWLARPVSVPSRAIHHEGG